MQMRFKFFGTEIYVSFLFVAVIAFMLATDRTGLVIPTLFAVLIHETGHFFAMWVVGCRPKAIRLIPASVQVIRGFSLRPYGEVGVAICGPAANIAVFLSLLLNYHYFSDRTSLVFGVLNLIIGMFNLLPVSGLDGGTILGAALSRLVEPKRADSIVKIITAIMSAAVLFIGIYMCFSGRFNISVFIVALYLLICSIIKR